MNRFDAADGAFFGRIINNSSHVMRPLLNERLSNQYNLRSRHHDFTLINKTNLLTDNSFIIRMLYKTVISFFLLCSDALVHCILLCGLSKFLLNEYLIDLIDLPPNSDPSIFQL